MNMAMNLQTLYKRKGVSWFAEFTVMFSSRSCTKEFVVYLNYGKTSINKQRSFCLYPNKMFLIWTPNPPWNTVLVDLRITELHTCLTYRFLMEEYFKEQVLLICIYMPKNIFHFLFQKQKKQNVSNHLICCHANLASVIHHDSLTSLKYQNTRIK